MPAFELMSESQSLQSLSLDFTVSSAFNNETLQMLPKYLKDISEAMTSLQLKFPHDAYLEDFAFDSLSSLLPNFRSLRALEINPPFGITSFGLITMF